MKMDYNDCYPELYIEGVPDEATEECMEFYEQIKKEFEGKPINEEFKFELNYKVNEFKQKLKHKYDYYNVECKINGGMAYHDIMLSVREICELHKEYYPARFEEKENYTRLEVNNMLFDLHIADVVKGYECIALPYSFADKYNNEIFDSVVSVKCRYL